MASRGTLPKTHLPPKAVKRSQIARSLYLSHYPEGLLVAESVPLTGPGLYVYGKLLIHHIILVHMLPKAIV